MTLIMRFMTTMNPPRTVRSYEFQVMEEIDGGWS